MLTHPQASAYIQLDEAGIEYTRAPSQADLAQNDTAAFERVSKQRGRSDGDGDASEHHASPKSNEKAGSEDETEQHAGGHDKVSAAKEASPPREWSQGRAGRKAARPSAQWHHLSPEPETCEESTISNEEAPLQRRMSTGGRTARETLRPSEVQHTLQRSLSEPETSTESNLAQDLLGLSSRQPEQTGAQPKEAMEKPVQPMEVPIQATGDQEQVIKVDKLPVRAEPTATFPWTRFTLPTYLLPNPDPNFKPRPRDKYDLFYAADGPEFSAMHDKGTYQNAQYMLKRLDNCFSVVIDYPSKGEYRLMLCPRCGRNGTNGQHMLFLEDMLKHIDVAHAGLLESWLNDGVDAVKECTKLGLSLQQVYGIEDGTLVVAVVGPKDKKAGKRKREATRQARAQVSEEGATEGPDKRLKTMA